MNYFPKLKWAIIVIATIVVGGFFILTAGTPLEAWKFSIIIPCLLILVVLAFFLPRKLSRILRLLVDQCDPEEFLRQSEGIARSIKHIGNTMDMGIIAYRSLALYDVGRIEDARRNTMLLLDGLPAISGSAQQLQALAITFFPVKRIMGIKDAYEVLHRMTLMLDVGELDEKTRGTKAFIEFNKELLDAESEHEDLRIALLNKQIIQDEINDAYTKTTAAWDAAAAYRRIADEAEEAQQLRFVVEQGNKLSCVPLAAKRLEELKPPGSRA